MRDGGDSLIGKVKQVKQVGFNEIVVGVWANVKEAAASVGCFPIDIEAAIKNNYALKGYKWQLILHNQV